MDSESAEKILRETVPENEKLIQSITEELLTTLDVYTVAGGNELTTDPYIGTPVYVGDGVDDVSSRTGRTLHSLPRGQFVTAYGVIYFTLDNGVKLKLTLTEEKDS
uniref:Head-to-tail stopper n=1 Tax=Micrococcus phage Kurnik TaxID=3092208 RepID=A0AAU6R595_9CAUD